MKKFRVFVDISEEEKYLNEMANKGYFLKKYSSLGRYHFIESKPEDLHYRVDYRVFKKKDDFDDYVSLFEDAGWTHVYGTYQSGSQYFLPNSSDSTEDIFSDIESKAGRYLRFIQAARLCSISFIIALIIILVSVNFNLSELTFLTPGLWEKQGSEFWRAFWFEVPFVMLRVIPPIALIIATILYSIWAIKAKKLYNAVLGKKDNI